MIGINVDVTEQEETQATIAADLSAMTRLRELGALCAREGNDQAKCLQAIVDTAVAITGAPRGSLQLIEPRSGVLASRPNVGLMSVFLASLRACDQCTGNSGGRLRAKEDGSSLKM